MDEKNTLTNEELDDIMSKYNTALELINVLGDTEDAYRINIGEMAAKLSKYDNIGCWATRDRLGTLQLWLGIQPPTKYERLGIWGHEGETTFVSIGLRESLFPYIKWEDSFPTEITIEET